MNERLAELLEMRRERDLDAAERSALATLAVADGAAVALAQARTALLLDAALGGRDAATVARLAIDAAARVTPSRLLRACRAERAGVRRRASLAAIAAVVASVVAAWWWTASPPIVGSADGAPLAAGATLRAEAASMTIAFHDGTRCRLGMGGIATVVSGETRTGAGPAKLVRLERGAIDAEVAPQPAGRPLVFATPHAQAVVVGTRLRLAVESDATRLEVHEGRVELRRGGAAVSVAAGEAARADLVGLAKLPPPLPPRFDFEDGTLPSAWTRGRVVAGPPHAGSRWCLEATLDGPRDLAKAQLSGAGRAALLIAEPDLELRFVYWAEDDVATLDVWAWDDTRRVSCGDVALRDLAHGRWATAVVPLARLRATDGRGLEPGDVVHHLSIQAGQPGGRFWLDDVQIVRAPR